jgi:guanylate cyclase activator 1
MGYVAAVHLVLRGKLEDRLRSSFKCYDRDGNGHLDKKELKQVVKVSV